MSKDHDSNKNINALLPGNTPANDRLHQTCADRCQVLEAKDRSWSRSTSVRTRSKIRGPEGASDAISLLDLSNEILLMIIEKVTANPGVGG